MKRVSRLLLYGLLLLACLFGFQQAQAAVVDTCAGYNIDPTSDNEPYYKLYSMSSPTYQMITDPTNPNLITLFPQPGTYTYGALTTCVFYNDPPVPVLGFGTYGAYLIFSSMYLPNFDFSGLPSVAVSGNRIDLSKVPASICGVPLAPRSTLAAMGMVPTPAQTLTVPFPGRSCNTGSNDSLGSKLSEAAGKKGVSKSAKVTQNPADTTSDPVDIFSGSFWVHNVDLAVPGIIAPEVGRQYYSAFADKDGPFGKGSGIVPHNASIRVATQSDGAVTRVAGTTMSFSVGDHTQVEFVDADGTLAFTAPGKTGFAGNTITVQTDAQNKMTGAVLAKPNGDRFTFNAQGRLVRIEDRNANAVTVTRDADQRITRIADPSTSKGIDFTYDAQGHITQATGLLGQTITYGYDDEGRLVSITNPLGESLAFTYDGSHRIVKVTDPRGVEVAENTYDAEGRVASQHLGDGSDMSLVYEGENVRKVVDGNGDAMEHRYNDQGMITALKSPMGREALTSYSPALLTDEAGPRTVTDTDPLNRQTVTELNAFNQPVRITDPAGRVTEFTYEPNFKLLSTIKDPLGRITRFNYDAQGNVVEAIDPVGNRSTFTYNAQGQVLTATDALGQTERYAYDPAHNLVEVTDPLGNKASFTYDALSRLTKTTDAKGNATTYTYDLLNRVTRIADALGNATTFAYDENGNVTATTDPRGNTTTATYDGLNRLNSVTNAKGETSTLSYDGAGQLVSVTDAKGQVTTHTYDADGRKLETSYTDGTTHSYTYDDASRLTKVEDGQGGTWSFAYDILDRLISEATPQGTLNYTYDLVSRLTGMSVSGGPNYAPVQYAYDALDRLTGITQNGRTYSYSYDALGRRTALNRPNGVSTHYTYDAGSRLTSLQHRKGAQVLEGFAYSYDANGNITRQVKSGGPYGNITRNYSYDPLDRLTEVDAAGILASSQFKNQGQQQAALRHLANAEKLANPTARQQQLKNALKEGAVLPENARWSFDANGNLVSKSVLDWSTGQWKTRTLAYDEVDRLVSLTEPGKAVTLTYDANGNLVSDSTGRQFIWDTQDQLVQLQTTSLSASFAYDPQGRRTSFSRGAVSRSYLLDGLDVLSDGTSRFLHGAGMDEPLELSNNLTSLTYVQDHLGSTSQLLDGLGNSRNRYDYNSYGKLEGNASNPQPANPYTYTGREDDGTGLIYYRARYYDPELEVFLSEDPLGDAQRYVGGNPLGYNDPLGLDAMDDINNFVTGFGDAGSFGISRYLRERAGGGATFLGRIPDTSSGHYTVGEYTSTAAGSVGAVRITYAGAAKALPLIVKASSSELRRALTISAARNQLKLIARLGMFPKHKMYTQWEVLAKYGRNPQAIIDAATRTNKIINAEAIILLPQVLGSEVNKIINISPCK